MPRVRPVLAALLLVLAGAVPVAVGTGAVTAPVEPADDPVVGVSENSSRVLLLTQADAAAFDQPDATVTNALAAGHAGLTADLKLKQVERKLSEAENQSARRAVLLNATEWVEPRVSSLLAAERAARQAYAAGDLSAREYVLTLGTLHARATHLQSFIGDPNTEGTVYTYASGFRDIQNRLIAQYARAASLRGPVSARVSDVVTGDRGSLRLHLTTGDGVMLSTVDGDTYYRQTYRPGNYDTRVEGSVPLSEASDYRQELYPWAVNNTVGTLALNTYGEGVYRFTIQHTHGHVVAYFDGSTERVYLERQEKRLEQLPVEREWTTTANNTTLSVSRTYAGGPLSVRVENATGELLNASVSINDTRVGTTGADGELWTVSPAGEYEVATTRNGTTVSVNVTAPPAPDTTRVEPSPDRNESRAFP